VGNGVVLATENSDSSILLSFNSKFRLKDVLYCPQATTNLLSIQKFCCDNDCCFKLTSTHFYVKDTWTSALLLEGKCENGLYPLRFHKTSLHGKRALVASFTAFIGIKTSSIARHLRLGHPLSDIVARVIKNFDLPLSVNDLNKEFVCDSCQYKKGGHPNNKAQTKNVAKIQGMVQNDQTVGNGFIHHPKEIINKAGLFLGRTRR
jgi:hypothetical protein